MSILDCCAFTEMEFSWRTHRPTLVWYTLHLTESYMDSCTSKTRGVYHTRYRSISRYYDEMGMKITFGSLSIHEYKYILKHNWLLFVKAFENEFGQERIPLVLRRKIDRSQKLLNMTPVQWPLVHSVDRYGRLYQSEQR